ncbi:MAG: sulfurtransferase [Chloroflexi bacterium]|nr:sulfurtransferase [Chloroflexota bacterium]
MFLKIVLWILSLAYFATSGVVVVNSFTWLPSFPSAWYRAQGILYWPLGPYQYLMANVLGGPGIPYQAYVAAAWGPFFLLSLAALIFIPRWRRNRPKKQTAAATSETTSTPDQQTEGYAHPELLAETDWLAQNLNAGNVVVVDVRNASSYDKKHIPGAVNIDVMDRRGEFYDQTNPVKWWVLSKEQIERLLSSKGISNDTTVVAVDDADMLWASRLLWTLEYYGHGGGKVKVLNGGLKKWRAEDRDLTNVAVKKSAGKFMANPDASKLATKQQVLDMLNKPENFLLAAMPEGEFKGGNKKSAARGGHIPGASHLDWTQSLTSGDVKVFKPAAELAGMFANIGFTRDKNGVVY